MKRKHDTIVIFSPLWLESNSEREIAKRIRAHRRQRLLFFLMMLPGAIAAVAFLLYTIATQ